ncbi:MAG: SMC-Scp complex subunit ScpB [Fibrobacter sp.]|nr:SMC-Scp complex subunit ScpB [Fibrobacter sp.]
MAEEVSKDLKENEEVSDLPKIESNEDLARIVQALVFASPDVVTLRKLKEIIGDFLDSKTVAEALRIANDNLNKIDSPFEIVEQAGGYRFRTRARYYPWVRKLFPDANLRRLSQAALETLSIVAYQQPITRAALEQVRGVSCDGPLKSLLEKKLIALGARAETVGNPYTYVTTDDFLKYFGINKIPEDLPRLREFQELLNSNEIVPNYAQNERPEAPKQPESNPSQIELSMGTP